MLSEYDAWEHICADAFDGKRGIVALLTAYFDAANDPTIKGKPDRPLIHSVGCYLGYHDDWRRFRREWLDELRRHGVDKGRNEIRYFHMTDFEWSLSQVRNENELPKDDFYYGWKLDEFLAFQKRLFRVLNRKRKDGYYRLAAFSSSVHKSEFDSQLPDDLKSDPECQSYYIFNAANVMKTIAFWCNRHFQYYQRDPIHYIFAGGDGQGGNLENWFNHCWQKESDRYYYRLHKGYTKMGYGIAWMEGEPALQAADVATFELSKVGVEVTVRGHSDIEMTELRKSLPVLFHTSAFGFTLTGEQLAGAFDQIKLRRKSYPNDDSALLPPL